MWSDPAYTPGYEAWEAPVVCWLIAIRIPFYVYLPTVILTVIFALRYAARQTATPDRLQILKIGVHIGGAFLGVITIFYALLVYIGF
jgi:hypothetical protein